jgi:hypothetical protein
MTHSQAERFTSEFAIDSLKRFWFLLVLWPVAAAAFYFVSATLNPHVFTAKLDLSHPPGLAGAVVSATSDLPEGVDIYREGDYRTVLTVTDSNAGSLSAVIEGALANLRALSETGEAAQPQYAKWAEYIKAKTADISDGGYTSRIISASVWTLFGAIWLTFFLNSLRRDKLTEKATS